MQKSHLPKRENDAINKTELVKINKQTFVSLAPAAASNPVADREEESDENVEVE